jgi:hypothetical protein
MIIGRVLSIGIVQYIYNIRQKNNQYKLKVSEIVYLLYGGMIRGGVCFALVLKA